MDRKIVEYMIIKHKGSQVMIDAINEAIDDWREPIGGVSMIELGMELYAFQAMVKYEDSLDK